MFIRYSNGTLISISVEMSDDHNVNINMGDDHNVNINVGADSSG